jgi:hypothetical protein
MVKPAVSARKRGTVVKSEQRVQDHLAIWVTRGKISYGE